MEDLSAYTIETRLIYGFTGAGKTYYIQDAILNDFFYKDGTTLVLCFEEGMEKYDEDALLQKRAHVAYYDEEETIEEFCNKQIEKYHPDRIYVEMNVKYIMTDEMFSELMDVTTVVTLIEWSTFDLLFDYFKQLFYIMVSESQQIIFRGCPSKELLAPYAQEFKLMNFRASYLRQDPMGYHEKAFDLFVPYSLDGDEIDISSDDYLVFWLDAYEHPEHYEDKLLRFTDPIEIRVDEEGWFAGRVVMTCCMSDLQYMSFELTGPVTENLRAGWATIEAYGRLAEGSHGQQILTVEVKSLSRAPAPTEDLVLQAQRIQN